MSLISWSRLPEGYTAEYVPHGDGVYWHLFCSGERVNGGLGEDFTRAQEVAGQCARQHKNRDEPVLTLDIDLIADQAWRERGRLAR